MSQWKLVQSPITEEMHIAASKVLLRSSGLDGTPQRMLDAMLAAAPQPAGEPVGYVHIFEKGTALSWYGESSDHAGRKDWIGCIPLFTYPPSAQARIAELEKQRDELVNALETLIAAAQEVADDHHKPRYSRLDEAIASAKVNTGGI